MKIENKRDAKFVQKNFFQIKNNLLRKNSVEETKFAQLLAKSNIYFVREKGNYKKNTRWCYYDFYLPLYDIYIEIDGHSHDSVEQKQIDKEKTQIVRKKQEYLIRYTNEEVLAMDSISIDEIIPKVAQTMRTKRHPHRDYVNIFYKRFNHRVNQCIIDIKKNIFFDVDENKKVYLYDHHIGEYFCFENIFYAKLNTDMSTNEIYKLLNDFEYKKTSARKYVFGWTLNECEANVAKVYY